MTYVAGRLVGHRVVRHDRGDYRCKCGAHLARTKTAAEDQIKLHRQDLTTLRPGERIHLHRAERGWIWRITSPAGGIRSESVVYVNRGNALRAIRKILSDPAYERAASPQERFDRSTQKTPTCWLWQGALRDDGYGVLGVDGRQARAHRYSYEQHVGPIPDGLVLDHLCRVRKCVNPQHLEPVTDRVNLLRGETFAAANAAKTACPQGHDYNQENTYIHRGMRHCKTCMNRRAA